MVTVIHQHGEISFLAPRLSPWYVSHLSSPSKQLYPSCIFRDMQGIQDFLMRTIRATVYPKEILHGGAKYPRILYAGVPRIGDAIYSVTPVCFLKLFF